MAFVAFVSLAVVLAIGLVPAWLLRNAPNGRTADYLVAALRTRPAVVRNAAIAYALRTAAFVPLFAWGATGDLWPAVVASACFGLGTWLVCIVHRPLVEFVDEALANERSITVHAFIASAHGDDARVRAIAAALTLCALFGLVVGEALAAAAMLAPVLEGSGALAALLLLAPIVAIAATVALSGHSGVMHSAQLQLGLLYFGLFGAIALVLYLHVSARTAQHPHVTPAIVFIAAFCAIVLWYRRSRYVDTDTIRSDERARGSRTARALGRFGKILNGVLSALLVLIAVVAILDLQGAPGSILAREGIPALAPAPRMSLAGLLALALLALFYPLVDVTNWLRLAAIRKDAGVAPDEPDAVRSVFAIYAVETALVGLVVCAFGAIAGVVLALPDAPGAPHAFASQLASADNLIAAVAAVLFAVCIFTAALSTMSALVAAGRATLRCDVLAPRERVAIVTATPQPSEATVRKRTSVASIVALGAAFAVAGAIAWNSSRDDLATGTLPAMLAAICCAQLSFAPLVMGAIVGRTRGESSRVNPNWAAAILAVGAVGVIVAVAGYVATGNDAWLWAAVPVNLGSGFLVYAIARAVSPRTARSADKDLSSRL